MNMELNSFFLENKILFDSFKELESKHKIPLFKTLRIKEKEGQTAFLSAISEFQFGVFFDKIANKMQYDRLLKGTTPDWTLEMNDQTVIAEVARLNPSKSDQLIFDFEYAVVSTLEQISIGCFLSYDYDPESINRELIDFKILKDKIENWLNQDPNPQERIRLFEAIEIKLEYYDPSETHAYSGGGGGQVILRIDRLKGKKSSLVKKLLKYNPIISQDKTPYIVCIHINMHTWFKKEDLYKVLYGISQEHQEESNYFSHSLQNALFYSDKNIMSNVSGVLLKLNDEFTYFHNFSCKNKLNHTNQKGLSIFQCPYLNMTPTRLFDEILRPHEKRVYKIFPGDYIFEYLSKLESELQHFLNINSEYFKLKNSHFNFIQGNDINACAINDSYNFIGFTVGLVYYSRFIFVNLLRDSAFLNDVLGDSNEDSIIIKNTQFTDFRTFIRKNSLDAESINILLANTKRREVAESLCSYFYYFILMHEMGHLRQKNRIKGFEFNSQLEDDDNENLKSQALEFDADVYAVNYLAKKLMKDYNRFQDHSAPIFFESKKSVVSYSLLILLVTFYVFSHNINFKKYLLNYNHPHPSLRLTYSVELLMDSFCKNGFINNLEKDEYGKQTLLNFENFMEKIFSNADIKKFFKLCTNLDLRKHHKHLQTEAGKIEFLYGYGYYY